MSLPRITLPIASQRVEVHLARSLEERERGLMHREDLHDNEGMLFIYPEPTGLCFWMKNTPLSLSIAFLADDGTVVNTDEMQAQTLDSHCAAEPVRYVLEMKSGWFARHGVRRGDRLDLAPVHAHLAPREPA